MDYWRSGLKLHKLSGPDSGAVGYYLREIRDEILKILNENHATPSTSAGGG